MLEQDSEFRFLFHFEEYSRARSERRNQAWSTPTSVQTPGTEARLSSVQCCFPCDQDDQVSQTWLGDVGTDWGIWF